MLGAARAGAAACLALALAGCGSLPPAAPPSAVPDPQAAFAARQARLDRLEAWTASGRIGVRSPDDAWSASVRWVQRGERYDIRLSGALGQGAIHITGEPGRVELHTADKQVYVAAEPEALLFEQTGWRVPVSRLRHWLLGALAPGEAARDVVLDPAGRLVRARQGAWELAIERYGESGAEPGALALPTKLSVEGAALTAKVVVGRWSVGRGTS